MTQCLSVQCNYVGLPLVFSLISLSHLSVSSLCLVSLSFVIARSTCVMIASISQQKLALYSKRLAATDPFPSDIPMNLLEPQLMPGDTVLLRYVDE
jgi:hypothetical protein